MDSRIILDQNGGETLLGQGDMLFLKPGTSELVRAQGAYLEDTEVFAVVNHLKEVAKPQFHPELMQLNKVDISSYKKDEMFDQAVDVVLETKRGSVSLLQRRLGVGYARASRMIEMMAVSGILGEYKGSQAREVVISKDEWEKVKRQQLADAAAGFSDLNESDDEEYDSPVEEVDDDEEYENEDAEEKG
jgi:S-DNA-T family DNA segregation ATPase FtsK/SpoIIIE